MILPHLPPLRRALLLPVWALLLTIGLVAAGCGSKKKAAADAGEEQIVEEDTVEEDTGEDVPDVVDVPDSADTKDVPKKPDVVDVPDVQLDNGETDVELDDAPDESGDLGAETDSKVDGGGKADGDAETADAPDAALDTSADGAETTGDADASDTVVKPVKCVTDADCATASKNPCEAKWVCGVDFATGDAACIKTVPLADGSPCDDGSYCTSDDACVGGVCGGKPVNCDDGNECTLDSCKNKATNNCKWDQIAAGACSDGDPCTVNDVCLNGKCTAGSQNKCDCVVDKDCESQDTANKYCEGKHKCYAGVCKIDKTTTVTCPASTVACQVNVCDPSLGTCVKKDLGNGTPCTDGNVCSYPDLCAEGACATTPVLCNDGNPCTDDACVAGKEGVAGVGCSYTNNKAVCNDGNACTGDGLCTAGSCKAGPSNGQCTGCSDDAGCAVLNSNCGGTYHCQATVCVVDLATIVTCDSAKDNLCQKNFCNESTGVCKYATQPVGVACTDGDVCTTGDHCDGGANGQAKCVKQGALNCTDGNPCTQDICLPTSGCSHPYNTAPCDDNNACTDVDTCTLGKCIGNPIDEKSGLPICNCTSDADCSKLDVNNCEAKHKCTVSGLCGIVAGTPLPDPCATVANKSECKTYACDPAVPNTCAITLKPDNLPCSDGDWCTQGDVCAQGTCSGTAKSCDDGNDCTTDLPCQSQLAEKGCAHDFAQEGLPCKLADLCQEKTACDKAGVCVGVAKDCNDGNPCTLDSCDPTVGCKKVAAPNKTSCTDGNPCTGEDNTSGGSVTIGEDFCLDGACAAAPPKDCKVPNSGKCYTSSCDPAGVAIDPTTKKYACLQVPTTAACQGSDVCIENQACLLGVCAGGNTISCDDANACTKDYCMNVGTIGCHHDAQGGDPCDDGTVCTLGDKCVGNTCTGAPLLYGDGNPCTTDSCDPVGGPQFLDNPAGDCGALAKCSADSPPKCIFASKPILISEVYVGIPNYAGDDWVELYNPTTNEVDLPNYALEVQVSKNAGIYSWTTLATTGANGVIHAHGYLLIAASTTVVGGQKADIVSPTFDLTHAVQFDGKGAMILDGNGAPVLFTVGQLRLRDTKTELVHDQLCFDPAGCTDLGKDVTPVTLGGSANSLERKATEGSTAQSMAFHKSEWLAGNAYTEGATPDDNFIVRLTPDPQTQGMGVYEPACYGYCEPTTVCNYTAAAEACVEDTNCAIGCGSGKFCNASAKACFHDGPGLVLSEVMPGTVADLNAQFVELYNGDPATVDVSGFVIQRKNPNQGPSDAWFTLYQFPAGSGIPAKRYFVLATPTWAATNGGVDALVPGSLSLDPGGGALRLWDPRTDVEMDVVGWGAAQSCSNCATGNKPASTVTQGNSLERKAVKSSNQYTMGPGGFENESGNAYDSDSDSLDWYERLAPQAQSLASGEFEAACGGYCQAGLTCPFTGTTGGTCADTSCKGQCIGTGFGGGYSCNISLPTPTCDTTGLVIAEVSPGGVASESKNGALKAADNEYILLYNRTAMDIPLKNIYISYRYSSQGSWLPATDSSTGVGKKPFGDADYIHPYSYYLIVPAQYDIKLPAPDFVATSIWGLSPAGGAVRISRIDVATKFDVMAWGDPNLWKGFGEGASTAAACPDLTASCALKRLPAKGVKPEDTVDLFSPWYYAGAGWDTTSSKDNWIATTQRTPRNSCLSSTATPSCSVNWTGVTQKP